MPTAKKNELGHVEPINPPIVAANGPEPSVEPVKVPETNAPQPGDASVDATKIPEVKELLPGLAPAMSELAVRELIASARKLFDETLDQIDPFTPGGGKTALTNARSCVVAAAYWANKHVDGE
jgi:hypothetical protein